MGYGPQQVSSGLFLLHFQPDLLLFLDPGSQCADTDRYCQHGEKCHGISCNCKIQCKIRIGKDIIHADHRCHGSNDAIHIAIRQQRDEQHRQYEQHGHMKIRIRYPMEQIGKA